MKSLDDSFFYSARECNSKFSHPKHVEEQTAAGMKINMAQISQIHGLKDQ